MQIAITIIFSIELALLFTHEMDAIRRQEWKMFVILKDMEEEKAHHTFLLLHIPLYTAVLYLLFSSFLYIAYYVVDLFLFVHMLVHLRFSNHPANKFNGNISKLIINSAGVLAVIHLIAISIR